ncbi:hypothetical protein SAMN06272783_4970 [Serratia sp. JKS296]|uniref:hypothetical protein n=1 Tax=Serratia sp. JKS296 TaxID=1938824 RepID=UPI000BD7167A|nr:hypothetical protein [Serratia sp. JKS296]SOD79803.1 hypothetical protein SAMN06272783_4970 [Serratia sp. JKS296]
MELDRQVLKRLNRQSEASVRLGRSGFELIRYLVRNELGLDIKTVNKAVLILSEVLHNLPSAGNDITASLTVKRVRNAVVELSKIVPMVNINGLNASFNAFELECMKSSFLRCICEHVVSLDERMWNQFIQKTMTGENVSFGIDTKMGEVIDPEDLRQEIDSLSRVELVEKNLMDSREPEFYVDELKKGADQIGEIDGSPIWFHTSGYYFYWEPESECLLESWLTFPVCPYG